MQGIVRPSCSRTKVSTVLPPSSRAAVDASAQRRSRGEKQVSYIPEARSIGTITVRG